MKSLLFLIILLILGIQFYSIEFLATILVISFLIFFHELGHFLAARSLGVKVEVFSIGFGKSLIQKQIKGTKYRLSALPIGGYVKLKGQDDMYPNLKNLDQDSYSILSPIKKIYILFAGSFFNLILAFFLYIIVANLGIQKLSAQIGSIMPNSAADQAGLQINDTILAINHAKIQSFDEIAKHLSLKPLKILVERQGEILEFNITPKLGQGYNDFGQIISKAQLGISPKGSTLIITHQGLQSIKYAINESIQASTLILKSIAKLLSAQIEVKNLGGIIAMTDLTSKAAQNSFSLLLFITALISINLGILNLLPIPTLDGGHILFNLYEMIFRRKIPPKAFKYLSYGGLIILLSLMLFTTYNDILRVASE
ncbi:RIP metalloprotease RseP [Campylobacter sp. VicNov18]|uniref:RIP metalloprotease RseP n=1 Tax=Campylobacter bilis TaxID=2691918 RepID=UPI00130D747C|nr:RIP metalloprotease RseP [Campylobacter bilis]MPV63686.1 RIP metalloprotease RseP [Campylobacter hepaticus]MBM0637187.1 RIP metalloprotease RseP [Campylobacter bilis]MCC8277904.1 RIP metalloprotease RseP [Campylobacter bilis]MCC8298835.1 RIP metalloprotease RseP [Campylobacter bilis]MCC8300814.1 RIP metalloprotease RseP [Campylobacter bilis]